MATSLQDQLLNSGLTNKSKANKSKKEKYKQSKQKRNQNDTSNSDISLQAQNTRTEKQEKDRELNLQHKIEADKKAIVAQIKQLIKLNCLKKDNDGTAYHFSDNKVVKTIYIDETVLKNISNGKLAIVSYERGYEVIPSAIAEKIKQRDTTVILVLNDTIIDKNTADDPYADYQIPDDLMW